MIDENAAIDTEESAPSSEEQAAQVEESAPQEQEAAEGTAETATATPESDGVQQRINQLTKEKYVEKRRGDALEGRLNDLEAAQRQVDSNIGSVPQLTDTDVDYDPAILAVKLNDYYARKSQVDVQHTLQENAQTAVLNRQQESIRSMEATYTVKADEFRKSTPKYDAAFDDFMATSQNQSTGRAILAADNSPAIINYLGNNLSKVEELNGMSPEAAAVAIGKLDAQLATAPQKTISNAPTPIDSNLSGSGSPGGDDFNKACPNAEFV